MGELLRGDLGDSISTKRPVLSEITGRLPATLELLFSGMLLAILVGVPLGVLSARWQGKPVDVGVRMASIMGVSMPAFYLGLLLQIFFFRNLDLLPLAGRFSSDLRFTHPIQAATGFFLIDSLLTQNWVAFQDVLLHLVLPALTLAAYPSGLIARMTRAAMLEVLEQDYIRTARAYGVRAEVIYRIARDIGRDHQLALRLWNTGIHEARAVAALVDDPKLVDEQQMERWVADFDSWAICDHVCGKLFDRTPFAWKKVRAWSRREPEFTRRAAYSLIAWITVHDKAAPDSAFLAMLPVIERRAFDERPMIRKAVNWALRQIGKRNLALNRRAIACAERLRRRPSSSSRWVAANALRELRSPAVQTRLRQRRPHP